MNIVVDTRYLVPGQPYSASFFTYDQLAELAAAQPSHRFIFIRTNKPAPLPGLPANAMELSAGPETTNNLLLQYGYNYKLPVLLRKQRADVFLAAEGICSLRTRVPQCLFVHDTSFIDTPALFSGMHLRFYRKHTGSFLAKAKTVITHSEYGRKVLLSKYPIDPGKILTLHTYADSLFTEQPDAHKEAIKQQYTDGKEFFLAIATGHANDNLLNLLKAFSFFKKRQKSNMQLIILGAPATSFLEDLQTYKFRADVRVLPAATEPERAAITAAAYALVYPALQDEKGQCLLEAMQCGVPVITNDAGAITGITGEAALRTNPSVFEDIAQKMMLLYKDEDMAKQLAQKGLERARFFPKSSATALLWSIIKKAANG